MFRRRSFLRATGLSFMALLVPRRAFLMATLTVSPNPAATSSVVAVAGVGFANFKTRLLLDGAGATTNVFRPRKDGTFNVGITVASTAKTQTLSAQQLGSTWTDKASISIVVQSVVVVTPPPVIVGTSYGALMADSARASGEYAAGLRHANLEAFWDRIETSDGVFNASQLSGLASQYAAFKTAGLRVILEPGSHYPPTFYKNTTALRYHNQFGGVGGQGLNVTWNATARAKVQRYLGQLATVIPFAELAGIRVGGGGDVELLYPNDNADGTHTGGYWAYDPDAQAACPVPGWTPGTGTVSQATTFFSWYLDALAAEFRWKADLYASYGFPGQLWAVMPGQGAKPSTVTGSLNGLLVPSAYVMARGAAWHLIADRLAALNRNVGLWCSSTAESAGMTDITQAGDVNVDQASSTVNPWSSHRWIAYLAAKRGLPRGGENPGYPATGYGLTMMDWFVRQAKAAGFTYASWAHDANLYNGTGGVSLGDYVTKIYG